MNKTTSNNSGTHDKEQKIDKTQAEEQISEALEQVISIGLSLSAPKRAILATENILGDLANVPIITTEKTKRTASNIYKSATEPKKPKDVSDKFYKICQKYSRLFENMARNSFITYVSTGAQEADTRIISAGRRQGYYLSKETEKNSTEETQDSSDDDADSATSEKTKKEIRQAREKTLYPYFKAWIESKEAQAADISSLRKNSVWLNPDILGIKIWEIYGSHSFEVITIEVKISTEKWQSEIFEAISHRQISNRVYFGFACDEAEINQLLDKFRDVAELYNIGILAFPLTDKTFAKLKSKDIKGIGEEMDGEDAAVVEIIPAPYQNVPIQKQAKFLENCGLTTKKKLMQMGMS